MIQISDLEFVHFQRFIYDAAGITLSASKKALVSGRLSKRVQHHSLGSFSEYLQLLHSGRSPAEVQTAIDLLTTNETYFFREPRHFDILRQEALNSRSRPFRVWSAASSSGEEAYSIAMVLADVRPDHSWELLGSDISSRVLERARQGHYPMDRARHIPQHYLKRFCLRGVGPQQGTLLVARELRDRLRFQQINLNTTLPQLGHFDVIFLRNVMIYFSLETKREVIPRLVAALKPGGLLLIGHSESLNDVSDELRLLAPSVYRKP